jgi:hypothetical protein
MDKLDRDEFEKQGVWIVVRMLLIQRVCILLCRILRV